MNETTRGLALGLGTFVGSAQHHLTKPRTYAVAGAIGLGVKIASKDNIEAVRAGAFATLGIIAYGAMTVLPHVVEHSIMEDVVKGD